MAPLPPPQGMSEVDYETIEAAVTETVRGRWFLGEFARRNRTVELRQVLEAMARIENVVSAGAPALSPPADPSIRLIMQRVKEIAAQLESLVGDMRDAGIEARFPDAIEGQARAVAGMMRGPGRGALPTPAGAPRIEAPGVPPMQVSPPQVSPPQVALPQAAPDQVSSQTVPEPEAKTESLPLRMPRAVLPLSLAGGSSADPRLAALSALDGLTLAKKLALFS